MWTNVLELLFLECYRQETILWDQTNRNRKERTKVHEAWKRISTKMEIPIKELKRKKDSLMATYRLHHRRMRESLQSAAEPDDVYRPVWFAFQYMNDFLGQNMKLLNRTIHTMDDDRNNGNTTMERKQCNEEDPPQQISQDDMVCTASRPTIWRKKNPPELQEVKHNMREAMGTLKYVLARNQAEDDCDLYGKMLAKKLRTLPEDERILFMYEIDGMFIRRLRELKQTEAGKLHTLQV